MMAFLLTLQDTGDELRFSAETNIADALSHSPEVAAVFIRYRMHCVGCSIAQFETLRTAAVNHEVDLDEFVDALNEML